MTDIDQQIQEGVQKELKKKEDAEQLGMRFVWAIVCGGLLGYAAWSKFGFFFLLGVRTDMLFWAIGIGAVIGFFLREIFVLVIIGIIGLFGYSIYHDHNKSKTEVIAQLQPEYASSVKPAPSKTVTATSTETNKVNKELTINLESKVFIAIPQNEISKIANNNTYLVFGKNRTVSLTNVSRDMSEIDGKHYSVNNPQYSGNYTIEGSNITIHVRDRFNDENDKYGTIQDDSLYLTSKSDKDLKYPPVKYNLLQ